MDNFKFVEDTLDAFYTVAKNKGDLESMELLDQAIRALRAAKPLTAKRSAWSSELIASFLYWTTMGWDTAVSALPFSQWHKYPIRD